MALAQVKEAAAAAMEDVQGVPQLEHVSRKLHMP